MKLYCPIKKCKFSLEIKAHSFISITIHNEFTKHLLSVHTPNQIINELYHLAIVSQLGAK